MLRKRSTVTVHLSHSADPEAVRSLLSSVAVLILKLTGNDVTPLKTDFKNWVTKSASVLTQLGIKKEFTRISNILQLTGEFYDEDALELGKLLNSSKSYLEKDQSVSYEELALFKKYITYLRSDSISAWKYIEKNVSILRNSKLNAQFVSVLEEKEVATSVVPTDKAVKMMQKYVIKLTGRTTNLCILPKELQVLRKDPKNISLLQDYGVYAKEIKEAVKVNIRNYVRKAGKELVPLAEVQSYLTKLNLPNSLPIGFTGGQIDETGHMFTREGRSLERDPIGVVLMNPKYDPSTDSTYVLQGIEVGRIKTLNMNASNKEARFDKVKAFFAKETSFRKAWLSDLDKTGSKEQVFATMVELLYKTSCRIGGKANATAGEPTYGLTTLQVRHLEVQDKKVIFNYSGKKSHDQYHEFLAITVEGRKIKAVLEKLIKGKAQDELVFTFKGKPLTDSMTNAYLRTHGIGITAHYFRRLTGTKMGIGILKMSPFKKSDEPKQAAVDKWILDEFKKVGTVLHHNTGTTVTGKTALQSYVDPIVMAEFFTGLGLRIPNFIPNTTKGRDKKEESGE